uniref:FRIGIDA-like protein n=1 Tax=Davidia involucrata TaxID=16924 RepID=A0A5B6YX63_DAVIN
MASLEKISADLKQAESKKDDLRKAFEHSISLFTLQWKDLEEYFDSTRKLIDRHFEDLKSNEKEFDSARLSIEERSKELESIEKSIQKRSEELQLKERQFDSTRLSTEERSKEFDSIQELINESFDELRSKEKEFDSIQQSIERRLKEVESKENQLEERSKELELKEKQFDSIQKSIEKRLEELNSKEKPYEEHTKQLKSKEKQCANILHPQVKVEQEEYMQLSSANLQFSVTMDGKSLQLFLNEHSDKHESMRDEVFAALKMSSDPAKLVLDAMQGFYPPYLKKGDTELEVSVIRRSCSLLLGQLMRVSPQIKPHVKEEAMKLAVGWKAKLEVGNENSLEVLGFLQVVATYGLVSAFDGDDLFKLFETIAKHREAPELFRELGFTDKVPDFIQILVKRSQNLAAVRFIYAFELVGKFPPVPVLEPYFKYWKNIADKTCNIENNLTKEQIKTAKKSRAALKSLIRCIEDHKLETEYMPEDLGKCIAALKEKVKVGCTESDASKAQLQQQSEKKCNAPSASAPKPQVQQQSGIKRPRTAASETTPKASTVHPIHRQPSGLFVDEGAPFPGPSVGRCMSSYPDRPNPFYPMDALREGMISNPFYPRDALREPVYYDGPVLFPGPMDRLREPGFYDGPPPFGSPRNALMEPNFYDGPMPFGGYDLPPPFHLPFYP